MREIDAGKIDQRDEGFVRDYWISSKVQGMQLGQAGESGVCDVPIVGEIERSQVEKIRDPVICYDFISFKRKGGQLNQRTKATIRYLRPSFRLLSNSNFERTLSEIVADDV